MDKTHATDAYTVLIARLKKRRPVAFIISILIFGILFYLSGVGILQTHWLTFLLLSIVIGIWLSFFNQLFSYLFFLRQFLIPDALKNARRTFSIFCANTAVLIFMVSTAITQQSHVGETISIITFSDIMLFIALSFFITLSIFIVISAFSTIILHVELLPKSKQRCSADSVQVFGDNHPIFTHTKIHEHDVDFADQARKNWERDAMNPASPEYQCTYRRWENLDD